MFLTQPTLTARLKALEVEVGDSLFVMTSRGMRLTEAGKEFLPYAERIIGGFAEGKRRLEELRGASGGRLRIGASPGVGTYALPGLLERFAAAHPRVSITVRTGHSEAILEMTLKEEVQLGLTRAMRHPEVESLPLYEDELVLVVDPGHRFTRRGVASLTELRTMEVDNIEAAKRMVEHRLGVAFVPRTAVVRSVSSGNLVLISIEENPEMSRSIVALKRRDVTATGPVAAFLEVAATMGEKRDSAQLSPTLATEFENLQLIDLFT